MSNSTQRDKQPDTETQWWREQNTSQSETKSRTRAETKTKQGNKKPKHQTEVIPMRRPV